MNALGPVIPWMGLAVTFAIAARLQRVPMTSPARGCDKVVLLKPPGMEMPLTSTHSECDAALADASTVADHSPIASDSQKRDGESEDSFGKTVVDLEEGSLPGDTFEDATGDMAKSPGISIIDPPSLFDRAATVGQTQANELPTNLFTRSITVPVAQLSVPDRSSVPHAPNLRLYGKNTAPQGQSTIRPKRRSLGSQPTQLSSSLVAGRGGSLSVPSGATILSPAARTRPILLKTFDLQPRLAHD